MIAEDAKRLAAQLDTVFEDVQMMWFDGARDPVVVPIARAAVLAPAMSAIGGKADVLAHLSECLLIATSGRSASRPPSATR